jgi:hypothetical protein
MITQSKLEKKLDTKVFKFSKKDGDEPWIGFRTDSGRVVRIFEDVVEYWIGKNPTWKHFTETLDEGIEHCRKYIHDEDYDEAIDWIAMGITPAVIKPAKPRYVNNQTLTLLNDLSDIPDTTKKTMFESDFDKWDTNSIYSLWKTNKINEFEIRFLLGSIENVGNKYTLSEKVQVIIDRIVTKIQSIKH